MDKKLSRDEKQIEAEGLAGSHSCGTGLSPRQRNRLVTGMNYSPKRSQRRCYGLLDSKHTWDAAKSNNLDNIMSIWFYERMK